MKQSLILIITFFFLTANAQDSTKMREDALNVYIDCSNTFCDEDYIRQNLSWVNYVRDRKAAQLHLLISSQSTAGNGEEYLLDFMD